MRVAIATLIQRRADGSPVRFPLADISRQEINWHERLDAWEVIGGDVGANPISAKYMDVQALARAGKYDAILFAESDMILPRNTLENLSRVNADVVYGLYCFRDGVHHWNATLESGRRITMLPDYARSRWHEQIVCKGIGLGCTLVRQAALNAFVFGDTRHRHADEDLAFKAQLYGLTQVCDLSVVCGHIDHNKSVIYWPDADDVVRIEQVEHGLLQH